MKNNRFLNVSKAKLIGSVLTLTTLFTACGDSGDNDAVVAPMRPVKVIEANRGVDALQRVLASTVISADSQNLSFRVAGAITKLPVDVGDRLKEGALVAALDQQPFTLGEKEAKAQLAQAEASFRNAESQYQRTRELYSAEAASLADLENARANASSAKANLSLAEEGLNSAQLNLSYSKLRSPSANCQVVSVPVAVNENVTAGQTIVTTACGDQLRVRTIVPESLINKIDMGMSVVVRSFSTDVVSMSGKVVEIAVSSNNSAGYPVEVELESPPSSVKVGMAAEVVFSLNSGDKRMLVPLIAVMSDSDGKFVFVAKPEEDYYRVVRQAVQTGQLDNDGIEIFSGIESGQFVVVAGMSQISPGMKVKLYSGVQN